MPKSLEDALKVLEGQEADAKELVAAVKDAIAAEKEKGVAATKKANSEAKGLRDRLKAQEPFVDGFKTLGFDSEDEDASLEDFIEGQQKLVLPGDLTDEDKVMKSKPYLQLQQDMKKLTKNFEKSEKAKIDAEKRAEELKTRQTHSAMQEQLLGALKDEEGNFKVFGEDLLVKSLIRDGRVKMSSLDEKTVVFIKGKGDDAEEIELKEGMETLLTERKDLLRNQQSPGGGSGGGGGGDRTPKSDAERLKEMRTKSHAVRI